MVGASFSCPTLSAFFSSSNCRGGRPVPRGKAWSTGGPGRRLSHTSAGSGDSWTNLCIKYIALQVEHLSHPVDFYFDRLDLLFVNNLQTALFCVTYAADCRDAEKESYQDPNCQPLRHSGCFIMPRRPTHPPVK